MFWAALTFTVVQVFNIAADSVLLVASTGLTWRSVIGANFFVAGLASVVAAVIIAAITARRERHETLSADCAGGAYS